MAPNDTYTHGHHESVLRSHSVRTAESSAGYLLPHLGPGQALLDIGCGPGTITADLAAMVAPGAVLAIDADPGVVDLAAAHLAARGLENATARVGNTYDLDIGDGSVDVVHAHQVLQHLSDPVAALVEMRRVCAPDGIVAARDADYSAMTWFPTDPLLDRWLAVYREVARSNDAEPDAGRRLLHWATEAGFGHIEASASVWCYADADLRAWWGGLWADRVVHSDMAAQAVERHIATVDELEKISAAWRSWAAAPTGWFAVLHGEVLCRI